MINIGIIILIFYFILFLFLDWWGCCKRYDGCWFKGIFLKKGGLICFEGFFDRWIGEIEDKKG